MNMEPTILISAAEAVQYLKERHGLEVKEKTFLKWRRRGQVKAFCFGRKIRFRRDLLDRFIERNIE
jgi:excisionase family DNA binding protein